MELTTRIKSLLKKSETDEKVARVYNNNSARCPWGEAHGSVRDFDGLFVKWCFSSYFFPLIRYIECKKAKEGTTTGVNDWEIWARATAN